MKTPKELRALAMPDVKKLVKKYGRTPVYGCLLDMSKEKQAGLVIKKKQTLGFSTSVKLPKNFGRMKD